MERDFIDTTATTSTFDVSDIPAKWNAGMKELLGVDVPSDAQECLQDVHWSMT